MGDMGDDFRWMKEQGRRKRAGNRETSATVLKRNRVPFVSKNCGAHLIVTGRDGLIDFWPGTGKFIPRGGKPGRGVFNLLKLCEVKRD